MSGESSLTSRGREAMSEAGTLFCVLSSFPSSLSVLSGVLVYVATWPWHRANAGMSGVGGCL